MVSEVSNLASELGNEDVRLLSRPAESGGGKEKEALCILTAEHLTKLSNLLELGILGPRA